jgi:transposase
MGRHQTDAPEQTARHSLRGRPRLLNGIFWVLPPGAPWRDLSEIYGPCTTRYNRFVRWRRAGVWDRIMAALAAAHEAAVQMIDTSAVRVHQRGGLHRGKQRAAHGPFAWWIDQQGSCRC